MRILIRDGRVIDPATHLDQVRDVLIEDTTISAIETPGAQTQAAGSSQGSRRLDLEKR